MPTWEKNALLTNMSYPTGCSPLTSFKLKDLCSASPLPKVLTVTSDYHAEGSCFFIWTKTSIHTKLTFLRLTIRQFLQAEMLPYFKCMQHSQIEGKTRQEPDNLSASTAWDQNLKLWMARQREGKTWSHAIEQDGTSRRESSKPDLILNFSWYVED